MSQTVPRRLDRVLALIRENTLKAAELNFTDTIGLTASGLAVEAGLDRTNVSKELNRLYRQGLVIKCQGKPTLFLHRAALASLFPQAFFPGTIPCTGRLSDYLASQNTNDAQARQPADSLEAVIGSNGSMKQAVRQAKAAMLYPPRGIHTLITGSAGIGKLRFGKTMYEYAKQHGHLAPEGKFIVLNCQDHSGSQQLLMAQLFGYGKNYLPGAEKGRYGLIEQAKGGILCLNGVQKLSPKVQELLATLIEKNTFCRMGESAVVREGETTIIATTTEPADSPSIERFVRNMPMLIALPNLSDRGPREILEHLALFISRESRCIKLPFCIHRDVLSCLLQAPYPGQIGELKGCVKGICSLAYLEYMTDGHASSTIEIGYRHLPLSVTGISLTHNEKYAQTGKLLSSLRSDYLTFSPEDPPELSLSPNAPDDDPRSGPEFPLSTEPLQITDVGSYINRCVDRIRSVQSISMERLRASFPPALCQAVDHALENAPRYKHALENPRLYYGFLLHLHNALRRQGGNPTVSPDQTGHIRRTNPQEYGLALKLQSELSESGLTSLPDSELGFIAMYLYLSINWTAEHNVEFITVFHGEGVSSGTAAFLNGAVRLPLVHGINCGPETSLGQVLEQATAIAQSVDCTAGLLIFTDMAPFTDLHHHLTQLTGIRAELISGASMPLMLRLVEKSASEHASLIALMSEAPGAEPETRSLSGTVTTSFLNRIIHEILSPSLTFLNPGKAADTLLHVLNKTLADLSLSYSDEIALKFIFHTAHMLERVIKGEPLNYPRLKTFINQHSALMSVLERRLVYAEEVFGVPIPASEKAYITEIFIPFVEDGR